MKYRAIFTVLSFLSFVVQAGCVTALFFMNNFYLGAAFVFSAASSLIANSALRKIESDYNAITQAEFLELLNKQQGLGNEITSSGKFN